jgi:hypothetical protein
VVCECHGGPWCSGGGPSKGAQATPETRVPLARASSESHRQLKVPAPDIILIPAGPVGRGGRQRRRLQLASGRWGAVPARAARPLRDCKRRAPGQRGGSDEAVDHPAGPPRHPPRRLVQAHLRVAARARARGGDGLGLGGAGAARAPAGQDDAVQAAAVGGQQPHLHLPRRRPARPWPDGHRRGGRGEGCGVRGGRWRSVAKGVGGARAARREAGPGRAPGAPARHGPDQAGPGRANGHG